MRTRLRAPNSGSLVYGGPPRPAPASPVTNLIKGCSVTMNFKRGRRLPRCGSSSPRACWSSSSFSPTPPSTTSTTLPRSRTRTSSPSSPPSRPSRTPYRAPRPRPPPHADLPSLRASPASSNREREIERCWGISSPASDRRSSPALPALRVREGNRKGKGKKRKREKEKI
jgi:hypothetical protein